MKQQLSLRNVGAACGFGLAAFLTLWGGLTVEIPGTGVVTDAREIFVLIGAALTGPVGALPIGILAGVAGVDPALRAHTILMHVGGALFVGWAYGLLLTRPFRLPGYLVSWFGIVICYYYVACLPLFGIEYMFFPGTFAALGAPGLSFGETLARVFRGWFVAFVLTGIVTTACFALLPKAYRRPIWLTWDSPVALRPLDISEPTPGPRRPGALALRLVAWFSLLGLFPLGIVAMFVRNDVEQLIYEHEGLHYQKMADAAISFLGPSRDGRPAGSSGSGLEVEAVVVREDGSLAPVPGFYMVDSTWGRGVLQTLGLEKRESDGYRIDKERDLIYGFSTGGSGEKVVVGSRISRMEAELLPLERAAFLRLAISLLLSSAFGGLVVWLLVGRPMRRLTESLAEVGAGKFSTRVDVRGMDDDVERVALSFNTMASNLEGLRTGLEAEIESHRSAARSMQALLREREALLKEVHHRVKNNLQVVCSLLHLQAEEIRDSKDAILFRESENRVRAMALIHEKLYRTKDFSQIDFREYAESLVRGLVRLFAPDRVSAEVEIADVHLGIDTAIPCGLIINELVTNAINHGFTGMEGGRVSVSLRKEGEREMVLTVRDNGVGIPPEVDLTAGTGIGLNLVGVLCEQLKGTLALGRGDGTTFTLRFPVPDAKGGFEDRNSPSASSDRGETS